MNRIKYHTGVLLFVCLLLISTITLAQCPSGINVVYGNNGQVSLSATITGTNSTATYFWNFGSNSPQLLFNNGVSNTYTTNGSYLVTLTYSTNVPLNVCPTSTVFVYINTVCGANINSSLPNPFNICNGSATATPIGFCGTVSYNWMSGTVSIGSNSSVTGLCKGTSYTLNIGGTNGPTCCATTSTVLTIPNTTCGLTASFTMTPPTSTGSTVYFNSTSSGISNNMAYVWVWGDGSPNGTTSLTPHTYSAAGSFTPVLRVTNNVNLCKDTIVKTLAVVPLSSCSLAASFTSTSLGNGAYNFVSTSTGVNVGVSYIWRFGDGSNPGSGPSSSHSYTSSGVYQAKLVVINSGTFTCRDSTTIPLTVTLATPCTLTAVISAQQTNSVAGQVNFLSSSIGTLPSSTYNWTFGNGLISTLQAPGIVTYTANGNYSVTLFVQNSSTCTATTSTLIAINNITTTVPCSLTANFIHNVGAFGAVTFTNNSAVVNNFTNYSWDFGDGVYSFVKNPIHTYLYNGAYNVKLLVNNPNIPNCRDSVIYSINITGLPCVAISNFNLSPTNIPQYWTAIPSYPWNVSTARWDWGDGTWDSLLYTSHTYSAAGTYSICLSVTVSCGATAVTCTAGAIYKSQNGVQDMNLVHVNILKPNLVDAVAAYEVNDMASVIYPNPNNGEFNLSIKGLRSGQMQMSIFNLIGEVVYESDSETITGDFAKEIKLDHPASGVYFVRINTGENILVKKMIIAGF